jgi:hypothetical protein
VLAGRAPRQLMAAMYTTAKSIEYAMLASGVVFIIITLVFYI